MDTFKTLINTILNIWNSISSLLGFFHQKKVEKVVTADLQKEEIKVEKTVETAVKNKDIDKLNELAGWKP
jgi:hypothetical protein